MQCEVCTNLMTFFHSHIRQGGCFHSCVAKKMKKKWLPPSISLEFSSQCMDSRVEVLSWQGC